MIIKGYRKALNICLDRIREISIKLKEKDDAEKRDMLKKCAMTSLNSKLINTYKEFFAEMVVEAVLKLDSDLDKNMIGVK